MKLFQNFDHSPRISYVFSVAICDLVHDVEIMFHHH